jgi:hypothetical protein
MQHTSVEWATADHRETKFVRRYGIPEDITGVEQNKRSYSRFWMILGVQMGDSGVRYRVTSQVASPISSMAQTDTSRRPRRAGVVVNQRLDVSEQDLLYWYGFDLVVAAPCQQFGIDLDHYVRHLNHPDARTYPATECPLP